MSNISESLSQKGQFAEAAEPIEKAVEIARERARELPEDSERKDQLAETLSQRGHSSGRQVAQYGHSRGGSAPVFFSNGAEPATYSSSAAFCCSSITGR